MIICDSEFNGSEGGMDGSQFSQPVLKLCAGLESGSENKYGTQCSRRWGTN